MSTPVSEHNSRGPALTIINAVGFSLSTVAIVARLYFRMSRKMAGLDDILILISLAFAIGHSICVQLIDVFGGRKHTWDVPPDDFRKQQHTFWVLVMCFVGTSAFAKLSIIAFCRRIAVSVPFYRGSRKHSVALTTLAIACVAYYLASILFLLIVCRPISYFWDRRFWDIHTHPSDERCLNEKVYQIFSGSYNTTLDFATLLTSLLFIAHLELPTFQRTLLLFLLSAGVVTCIAGTVRTILFSKILLSSKDPNWDGYNLFIASLVEVNLGIVCACLPACKTMFQRYMERKESLRNHKLDASQP